MIAISAIEPDQIATAWPYLEPHFARACERVLTDWTPDKIRTEAEANHLTIWSIYEPAPPGEMPAFLGALATCLKDVKGEKVLVFSNLGGRDMHRWLDRMVSEIEGYAKSHGATCAEIEGRLGWHRKMTGRGYAPTRVVLRKVL